MKIEFNRIARVGGRVAVLAIHSRIHVFGVYED